MLVIGIDPGTAITGYGLVQYHQNGQIDLVDYGAITTEAGTPMAARLDILFRELGRLLEMHRPESAAVEQLFFQKNVSTAISVGQARGVALLSLAQFDIPVNEYSPNEVKVAISGYGGADKRQMQTMVKTLLGLAEDPEPDDAADALAVAICHCHSSKLKSLSEAE